MKFTLKACESTSAVDKKNAVDWITTWVNREQILTEMCMLKEIEFGMNIGNPQAHL